jgi:hypothetical protein
MGLIGNVHGVLPMKVIGAETGETIDDRHHIPFDNLPYQSAYSWCQHLPYEFFGSP